MNTRFNSVCIRSFLVGWGFVLFMSVTGAVWAEAQSSATPSAEARGAMSAEELNRQLNNPVSSVWSMVFQNNYTQLKSGSQDVPGWDEGDDKWFYNLNFQPVLPLPLTRDWNLINRPVFPIFVDRPVLESDGFNEAAGLGDIGLVSLLFSLGGRAVVYFPHRLEGRTGAGKVAGRPGGSGPALGERVDLRGFPSALVVLCGQRRP
jgi:hypothetical protein